MVVCECRPSQRVGKFYSSITAKPVFLRACLPRSHRLSVYLSCAPRRACAVGPSLPCSVHGRFRIVSVLNARCPSISASGQPQCCGHRQITPRISKLPALAGRARVGYPLPSLRAAQLCVTSEPASWVHAFVLVSVRTELVFC